MGDLDNVALEKGNLLAFMRRVAVLDKVEAQSLLRRGGRGGWLLLLRLCLRLSLLRLLFGLMNGTRLSMQIGWLGVGCVARRVVRLLLGSLLGRLLLLWVGIV